MGSKWTSSLESTRPPDGSTRFVLVGARRVFASSTNTCYLSGRHHCFSHRSHPGCLDRELVEAVSEAFSGGNCGCLSPPRWLLERWHYFCCKTYQGKEQMQEEDLWCSGPSISSYNKSFPPWIYLDYSPLGVTSFVSLYQPLGCPVCSWDRVVSSGETVEICVSSSFRM